MNLVLEHTDAFFKSISFRPQRKRSKIFLHSSVFFVWVHLSALILFHFKTHTFWCVYAHRSLVNARNARKCWWKWEYIYSIFGKVCKSFNLKAIHYRNGAFCKCLTFEIGFISVFDPFSVDDRRKCLKECAFSCENGWVVGALKPGPKIQTLNFILNLGYATPNLHSSSAM